MRATASAEPATMVHGIHYVERGLKKYEEKGAQSEQALLQKLARKYNLVLQPKVA